MKSIYGFLICAVLLIQVSCAQKKYVQEGYTEATVIDYKVDGCKFLLELNDEEKTKLSPNKLPDELKKDQQKVWVKYSVVKKQMLSTCMAGKQIEVLDIQKRK